METLDDRKLQKTTSGGTFLISLPGEWIRANSLKKGNELTIRWSKSNNYLLIFPKQENKKTRTEITINESDSERTQLVSEFREQFGSPYAAAASGHVDDVILPSETRARLAAALEFLRDKQATVLPKKHGNIPL